MSGLCTLGQRTRSPLTHCTASLLGANDDEVFSRSSSYILAWKDPEPDLRAVAESFQPLMPAALSEAQIERLWATTLKVNDAFHDKYALAARAEQVSFTTLDAAVQRLRGEFASANVLADASFRRAVKFVVADRLCYVLVRAYDAYKAKFGDVGNLSDAFATLARDFGLAVGRTAGGFAGGLAGGAVQGVAGAIPWWIWVLGGLVAVAALGYFASPIVAAAIGAKRAS